MTDDTQPDQTKPDQSQPRKTKTKTKTRTDRKPADENNRVHLTGRISADPESRELPSGDQIVSFRLVVRRSAAARRRSRQVVDTIECSVWPAALRRSVAKLPAGTEVTVTGSIRRRFSRGGAGVASWVSVDVDSCRKVSPTAVTSQA